MKAPGKMDESTLIEEHDKVTINKSLPALGLEPGATGFVVHVHANGKACEVKFMDRQGGTIGVATLELADVRRLPSRTEHVTPVGGNIYLDLGFPSEDATALKAESDRIIATKLAELSGKLSAKHAAFNESIEACLNDGLEGKAVPASESQRAKRCIALESILKPRPEAEIRKEIEARGRARFAAKEDDGKDKTSH